LQSIGSISSLLTATVNVTVTSGRTTSTMSYPSPLSDPAQQATLLPLLFDKTTTTQQTDLPPRININTASSVVLSMLPGLAAADVQTILDNRPQPGTIDPTDLLHQTPAWLLTDANISPTALAALESYVTARSQVYRMQVIGYFDGGGPSVRVEAVVDTNSGRPRIVYRRDLTEFGKGFDMTQLTQAEGQ
jgi:hypothetical protein